MNNEDKIREINSRISRAIQDKARAQIELETATESRAQALKSLSEDFGITTTADAERVNKELTTALEDAMAEAIAALDSI